MRAPERQPEELHKTALGKFNRESWISRAIIGSSPDARDVSPDGWSAILTSPPE